VGDLDQSNLFDPTHDTFVYFVQNTTAVSRGGTVSGSVRRRASGSLGSHRAQKKASRTTITAPRMLKIFLTSVYCSAGQMLSKTRTELLAFITP
jgi:hypothetical protein